MIGKGAELSPGSMLTMPRIGFPAHAAGKGLRVALCYLPSMAISSSSKRVSLRAVILTFPRIASRVEKEVM